MPRKAREQSSTGLYHIMLRGINRQQIFEDTPIYAPFARSFTRKKPLLSIKTRDVFLVFWWQKQHRASTKL